MFFFYKKYTVFVREDSKCTSLIHEFQEIDTKNHSCYFLKIKFFIL